MSVAEQQAASIEIPEPSRPGGSKRVLIATVVVLVLVLAGLGVWAISNQSAEPSDPPDRVLFFGNSFSDWNHLGLDYHVTELAASATPQMTIDAYCFCKPGATLQNLWGTTELLDGELVTADELIASGDYDVVVLQGDVALSRGADSFREYARTFDAAITAAGAKTVIYMPQKSDGFSLDFIAEPNEEIADELGADLAPVGVAFERAETERPELELYDPDNVHGSIHGVYLGANVAYATIFGDPTELTYVPDGITEDEASFLRRIAWETVQEYLE